MKLSWMRLPCDSEQPRIVLFRTELRIPETGEVPEILYSADETCQWFADGRFVDAGPECGSPERWYYGRLDLKLAPGVHTLVARVCHFGKDFSAASQMSIRHGFACSLPGPWSCREMSGVTYEAPWPDWGSVPRIRVSEEYDPAWLSGQGSGWCEPESFDDARVLHAPELPSLLGGECTDFTVREGLVQFAGYECLWPSWRFSGRGTVSIRWGETPYLTSDFNPHTLKGEKGRRDGAFRVGKFDVFEVNGTLDFTDLQWRAGRYAEIRCTGSARMEKMSFHRTGYPYRFRFDPKKAPAPWRGALRMARRTLECCSHDRFMDCPFYERLMYIGDTRIEALCAYAAAEDDLLARKALRFFALSQKENGAILSRYPAKVEQIIPSFSAIFILMLHDFMVWRRDRIFIAELLPAARKTAGYLLGFRRPDGLIYPEGWNFIDWQWPHHGVPYGSECGTNSILNLMIALALQKLGELERYAGRPDLKAMYEQESEALFRTIQDRYYTPEKQLFADDLDRQFFSEHAQVLAMLFHDLPQLWDGMKHAGHMTECGIYFSHYYLEACRLYKKNDLLHARFQKWCELEPLGLKTLPEDFSFPRSDCHAWSAHILYHYLVDRVSADSLQDRKA